MRNLWDVLWMRKERLESGFVLPTVISGGRIQAPRVCSPLGSQPLSKEFLCCSNPGGFPVTHSFGELLCSAEQRERFAAGSPQFLRALLSAWDGGPGWLSGQGCCQEQRGLTVGSLPRGKGFHAEMSQLGLSGETDGSLQNSRGKHENIPAYMIINLKWPKEKVLSTHKRLAYWKAPETAALHWFV